MTVHRVFVQGRIVDALKDFTVPVTLRVLTDATNADPIDFQLGTSAVRAALVLMERKGLVEVTHTPSGTSLFRYTPFGIPTLVLLGDN